MQITPFSLGHSLESSVNNDVIAPKALELRSDIFARDQDPSDDLLMKIDLDNFNSLDDLASRNFVDQIDEISDRATSNKSDKKDQKLRKLPKSQLIKKVAVQHILIRMGIQATKDPRIKASKNRQLRKSQLLGRTPTKQQPNDITESDDPQRTHFSNNVLQIMQKA